MGCGCMKSLSVFDYCQTQLVCSHKHIFQMNELDIVVWASLDITLIYGV